MGFQAVTLSLLKLKTLLFQMNISRRQTEKHISLFTTIFITVVLVFIWKNSKNHDLVFTIMKKLRLITMTSEFLQG